jgi:fimbrial isopeptide formation D2 family protein
MRLLKKVKAALGGLCSQASQSIIAMASLWLPLLIVLAFAGTVALPAHAATEPETTLTNTVSVSYTVGSGSPIEKEASVSLTTSARTPAKIEFFSVFESGESINIPNTSFSPTNSSGTNWTDVDSSVQGTTNIIQTFGFTAGESLIIRVEDFDQNLDGSVQETIRIDLEIDNTGDTETLLLTESEPGSGVFIGVVPMVESSTVTSFNGELSVQVLSRIGAVYTDVADNTDTVNTLGIVDPSNLVFDSITGELINGATITLVNSSSGQGARVYSGDSSDWPSTVVSGAPVVLAPVAARHIEMGDGEFSFPRVFSGSYHFEVTPPVGYSFPSQQSQSQIAQLGAVSNQVATGSRGETFTIEDDLGSVQLNIPLDPFDGRFSVQKTVDETTVSIGDEVKYTLVAQNNDSVYELNSAYLQDTLPVGFRYQEGSAVFSSGDAVEDSDITVDGRNLKIVLGDLDASQEITISYRALIGAGAVSGEAVNVVQGISNNATSNVARAAVEIVDELMRDKSILIGRVFTGSCEDTSKQKPVKNVSLYLDNGRSVLTDERGRWHLEGVTLGTHVIQLDETSLPKGMVVEPCKMIAQNVGKPYARIMQMHSGNIWRADFRIAPSKDAGRNVVESKAVKKTAKVLPTYTTAIFDSKFSKESKSELEILWPPEGHVPSISSIKIAVKYPSKQRIKVLLNETEVSALNLDGTDTNKDKTFTIKSWKGVDLKQKNNTLTAILLNASGKELKRTSHHIHFTEKSIKATLVRSESSLVADGKTRPVVAIRLEDEDGFTPRPRTHGFFSLGNDHWTVIDKTSEDDRAVAELNSSKDGNYEYIVSDDGLVRIEFEPSSRSGEVIIDMPLSDDEDGRIRAWLQPELRDWIMVGFAKGTLGYKTLSGNMQTLSDLDEEEGRYTEGEVSFFAKGRVKGDYLLTVAYDSDKEDGEVGEQLNGVVDPDAWYTLYGDEQTQLYQAPSSSKLFLKLEKEQFFALFGDYETNLDRTDLGRYERTLHGLKASYEGETYQYKVFASETSLQYQRDDIRGDGTSGMYYLTRDPVANSESIAIEVRDRDNPEDVVSTRSLQRYTDYDIDYEDGSLFFKFPISSSDDQFNPMYIVADYESEDEGGEKELVAGGRVGYTSKNKNIELGLSYLQEGSDNQLLALDGEFKATKNLTLNAEVARSKTEEDASAWSAEAEYRKDKWQTRVYAQQQDEAFGLDQQSDTSAGERKIGASTRYEITADQALALEVSELLDLEDDDTRLRSTVEWTKNRENGRVSLGYRHIKEESNGDDENTQSLIASASKSFKNTRASFYASLEKSLDDELSESNPDRIKVGADYKLNEKVSLFAEQEYSQNGTSSGNNTRVGLKMTPWDGGSISTNVVQEKSDGDTDAQTKHYAVLGLSQHWKVNDNLFFDVGFDKARTLDFDYFSAVDPDLTIATDDYYAISLGTGWTNDEWSFAGRVEFRDSESTDRKSVQYNAVRKQDDHYAVSKTFRWIENEQSDGDKDSEIEFGFNFALRSKELDFTLLNELSYSDEESIASGVTSTTRKLINNLHYNRPIWEDYEFSIHHGIKLTQSETDKSHWGVTDTLQAAVRYDINEHWDAGAQLGYLNNYDTSTISTYAGVSVGFSPVDNTRIEVGYNFDGFDDDDFGNANYTHEGPYISLNYLLDQSLLRKLGVK